MNKLAQFFSGNIDDSKPIIRRRESAYAVMKGYTTLYIGDKKMCKTFIRNLQN